MKVSIIKNGEIVFSGNSSSDYIQKPERSRKVKPRGSFKVSLSVPVEAEDVKEVETIVEAKAVEVEEETVATAETVEPAVQSNEVSKQDHGPIVIEEEIPQIPTPRKAVIRSSFIPKQVQKEIEIEEEEPEQFEYYDDDDEEYRGSDPMNRKRNSSSRRKKGGANRKDIIDKY